MKVYNSDQIKKIDQLAINSYKIPGCVLMENAGRETIRELIHERGSCSNTYAIILVGPGNNGGDGLVVGRHLYQRGCHPIFVFLSPPEKLPQDALINYEIIKNSGLQQIILSPQDPLDTITDACLHEISLGKSCYCCVDAFFGIGLSQDISGQFEKIIQNLNNHTLLPNLCEKPFVVSCDIPSGLTSNTGQIQNIAVKADLTVTYSTGKPGLYTNAGTTYCGKLKVVDIGIPKDITETRQHTAEVTDLQKAQALQGSVTRTSHSHKGTHGHLGIIAGSVGMTGAAILSARGGLRSGAGLVSLIVPESLNTIFETTLPEAMTVPTPSSSPYLSDENFAHITTFASNKTCLILGPGLGLHQSTEKLVCKLYSQLTSPMVVDADAINLLARFPEILEKPGGPRIFTPHPAELARMLQCTVADIQNDRFSALKDFTDKLSTCSFEIVGLLKGNGTLIASTRHDVHNGQIHINTTGNNGMATGGMGDVLSGIIGGLVCQGYDLLAATQLGTFLHGMAADQLLQEKGVGFTASEVCEALPQSRKCLAVASD